MDALAKRIDMFTNGDVEGFVNSYTPDALQVNNTQSKSSNQHLNDGCEKLIK